MTTYTDSVDNSYCADFTYVCAGAAVQKAHGDFLEAQTHVSGA
eukprot:CAMPEP_0184296266 /NCGR_PEP_ID=MMETSP1049-20130417/7250_1 /TAXON_ID=77928 /ORGANISM="Proteomonas sulcata, Strain CCMP704" /LENGTH=42 /DNA_ID= /DNA_START= /DNA_END= /DNA_ORIENTATION=